MPIRMLGTPFSGVLKQGEVCVSICTPPVGSLWNRTTCTIGCPGVDPPIDIEIGEGRVVRARGIEGVAVGNELLKLPLEVLLGHPFGKLSVPHMKSSARPLHIG